MDEETISKDLPQLLHLVQDVNAKIDDATQLVDSLKKKVSSSEFNTEQGISFLELKYHLLLSYVLNLAQVMLLKCEGSSISKAPPIVRLVEIRTVLEKMRPLEHKLQYQVDKLIRTATTRTAASINDPLRFKPNPSNLVSKLADEKNDSEREEGGDDSEEDDDDDELVGEKSSKLYVPPRVMAVPYQEDSTKKGRKSIRDESARGALIQELRDELTDAPSEFRTSESGLRRQREVVEEKQRERFEEEHMLRLPQKRRRKESGRSTRETLDTLTDFSTLETLTQEVGDEGEPVRKKGRRKGARFKKGVKRRKRKH